MVKNKMIGSISGVILKINTRNIVVDVSGVGYVAYVPNRILGQVSVGDSVQLFTHLSVRENALDLYGFTDWSELELFELLTTVNGVGPKAALSVLDGTTVDTLISAIAQRNISLLQSTPGIGKKTAEKIALELSDKVALLGGVSETGSTGDDSEIIDALEGLGFRARDIHQAIADKPELRELETNEKIKRLISLLGK